MNATEFAGYFDHTLLKPETTEEEIIRLAAEAENLGCAAVCTMPYWVPRAVATLSNGSETRVCTVVGFPLGAHTAYQKRREAAEALAAGAHEIDMVMNLGAFLSGDRGEVGREIEEVAGEFEGSPNGLKVIIETSLLTEEQMGEAARLAADHGAAFVKTSTGYSGGGATVEQVRLLRRVLAAEIKVKASGGIGSARQSIALIDAGADRIGASRSATILGEFADGPSELFPYSP